MHPWLPINIHRDLLPMRAMPNIYHRSSWTAGVCIVTALLLLCREVHILHLFLLRDIEQTKERRHVTGAPASLRLQDAPNCSCHSAVGAALLDLGPLSSSTLLNSPSFFSRYSSSSSCSSLSPSPPPPYNPPHPFFLLPFLLFLLLLFLTSGALTQIRQVLWCTARLTGDPNMNLWL